MSVTILDLIFSLSLILLILSTFWMQNALRWIVLSFVVIYLVWQDHLNTGYILLLLAALPPLKISFFHWLIKLANAVLIKTPPILLVITCYLLLILLTYSSLFNSYFEGEEWLFLREFSPILSSKYWFIESFILPFQGRSALLLHHTPVSTLVYAIQYKFFGLQFVPYVIVSLGLHLLSCIVLYLFFKEYTGKTLLSFMIGAVFAVLTAHSQAVTWIQAASYTQLAVLFGFLSLYYTLRSFSNQRKYFYLSGLALLCAVWSKETAIAFIPLNLLVLFQYLGKTFYKSLQAIVVITVVVIALLTQMVSRAEIVNTELYDQPWLYDVVTSYEKLGGNQLGYWTGNVLLKGFSQAIVPINIIMETGVWITDKQFPFFNQEKAVRGTTYLQFIQSVAPEFVSYIFSVILLGIFIHFYSSTYKKLYIFLYSYYIFSMLPLVANISKFPFLAYSSFLDSRHFYHISPSLIGLFILTLHTVSVRYKKHLVHPIIFMLLGFVSILGINVYSTQQTIAGHQQVSHFEARKSIISTLINEVPVNDSEIVIYTSSNKSYYGFGYWMLPFQTAFSHMLPVIFSETYRANGLPLPNSFYTSEYLADSTSGLVTQGYYYDNGYGLGYFLDKITLLKAVEDQEIPITAVHSFKFDGDTNSFINETENIRSWLQVNLEQRRLFLDWKRYGNAQQYYSFQYPADYTLSTKENVVEISNIHGKVLTVENIPTDGSLQFSDYVYKQLDESEPFGPQVTSNVFITDFDQPRLSYQPVSQKNTYYLVAGNNLQFYKISVHQSDISQTIFRTFEFIDEPGEKIHLL